MDYIKEIKVWLILYIIVLAAIILIKNNQIDMSLAPQKFVTLVHNKQIKYNKCLQEGFVCIHKKPTTNELKLKSIHEKELKKLRKNTVLTRWIPTEPYNKQE